MPLTILSIVGGEVQMLKAGTDTWQKAEVGTTLDPGDAVKSARGSRAEITFFDGSTIELKGLTQLIISELNVDENGSTTIRLVQSLGKTVSRVKKLAGSNSRYEVDTPAAVAAVRGSIMEVTVEYDGTTTVANVQGDIRIYVNGKEYLIREGMKRTIVPGEEPGPEVPINPPGGGGGGGGYIASPQGRMEVTVYATPPVARVGDIISYTYYLRNTGDLPLNNISVSTDITGNATYQSGDGNVNAVLDRGETWLFTSSYIVHPGDPSPLVATTTVSALTFTSVTVIDTEIVTTSIEPDENDTGIVITKVADPLIIHEEDSITYYYYVFNTGNVSLSDVSVIDNLLGSIPLAGGDDNGNGLLETDEMWVYTANYTAISDDPDLLVNTVDVSGTDLLEETVADSDNASVSILRPGIAVFKTAEPSQVHEGDEITYTYTLTNTGNTPLSNVSVADDRLGSISLTSGDDNENDILDTDEIWVFTAFYTADNDDPFLLVNLVEATGEDALGLTVTDSDIASVYVLRPGISLIKNAEPSQVHEGDYVTYTYTVINTNDIPLSDISVTDDRLGSIPLASGDDNGNGMLDGDETWIFTASYVTNADDPGLLVNTANVSGTDPLEKTYTDSDIASVSILRPGISIVKVADPPEVYPGDNVTYTYTVTNTGNTPLSSVSVIDDLLGSITLSSGDGNGNSLLDGDETWLYTANYTTGDDDPSPLLNTAEASGIDALEQTVTDADAASVVIIRPDIALVKTAEPSSVHLGDNITYTYTVSNTGSFPLSDISVVDDLLGSITLYRGDDNENGMLDDDETWIFTANYTVVSGDPDLLINNAEVSGTYAPEETVSDTDTASVSILRPGIALVKVAEPLDVHEGDDITYTYTVTNTGNTPLSSVTVIDDRLGSIALTSGDDNANGLLDTDETWVFIVVHTADDGDPDTLINNAEVSGRDALGRIVTDPDTATVTIHRCY